MPIRTRKKREQMPLEISELKARLQNPRKKGTISKAVDHENRLKLHGKTALGQYEASRAVNSFLQWVKEILPYDKFQTFLTLFQFPVETIPLTGEIFEALAKIFDGRDPVYKYQFVNDSLGEDWAEYKEEKLHGNRPWYTQGLEAMKYGINSILIVDLPREQDDRRPEPYFYFLPIDKVVEYEAKDENQLEWIAYRIDENQIAVLDDTSYRLFSIEGMDTGNLVLLLESEHGLEYCPARFFWSKPISWEDPTRKASPITDQLRALDWYLFFAISKKHLDLYAPYPIYSGFASDCDYSEPGGAYCDGGYLRGETGAYIYQDNGRLLQDCPACSKKRLAGVGSFVEVDPPGPHNGNADLRNPVQVLPADTGSLQYNVEEMERLREQIYQAVTGNAYEAINNQAVNEKQVASLFESRKAVLTRIKKNFEQAQEWVEKTICRLRYGAGFSSLSISYGTEFYLFSPEQILEMYTQAREAKLDFGILDMLQEQYYETKYRNNPDQLQRSKIIIDLDPFRHLTPEEAKDLYNSNMCSREDYYLKANFSTLLGKFEREQLPVLDFAEGQTYDRKIALILEGLKMYIPAVEQVIPEPEPPIQ
jgi:hypothetical protein